MSTKPLINALFDKWKKWKRIFNRVNKYNIEMKLNNMLMYKSFLVCKIILCVNLKVLMLRT